MIELKLENRNRFFSWEWTGVGSLLVYNITKVGIYDKYDMLLFNVDFIKTKTKHSMIGLKIYSTSLLSNAVATPQTKFLLLNHCFAIYN